jgi:predicted DNA-binding transcriptional regulator AlpA
VSCAETVQTETATLDLLGVAEIAEMIGVGRKTVAAYVARGQMPAPDARLACGPIWQRSTIDAWQSKRDERNQRAETRLAELEKRHEKILRAITARNEVAGAQAFQAGRNMRARKRGGKRPTITQQRETFALRELERVIEQRSEVPAVRRLAAEFAEADRLRDRITAANDRKLGLAA